MLAHWKDRIDGIKRIVLALGVMCLCIMASLQREEQLAASNPTQVQTAHADYDKCSASMRKSQVGIFGCAVMLKTKVKVSSIRFLSSGNGEEDARGHVRPFIQVPGKP
jgi:hypothetical protein